MDKYNTVLAQVPLTCAFELKRRELPHKLYGVVSPEKDNRSQ